jgi:glycosyltransferase involved in cell wall biosynthesis
MPPVRSGVAACSAQLVPALREFFDIDVYVDASAGPCTADAHSAHDFVWRHHQVPYDLTVYQLGNSATHDFIWPYLVRYPGLTVLHDAHLHHERAAALLRAGRPADYRAEFTWNHPEAEADLAELAVAGFDSHLYYYWPMTRLPVLASRLAAVHARTIARQMMTEVPGAAVEPIRLGHGVALSDTERTAARRETRDRLGISDDAIVFGCFGGLSPEKRIPQILEAFADVHGYVRGAHLLLAGAPPAHYDPVPDLTRLGIRGSTTLTGYIDGEDHLTAHIAACDVGLTLRWPTAREISGPWLRCLAAAIPTVTVQLAHLVEVPALDPRTWQPHSALPVAVSHAPLPVSHFNEPVCVAIDILDEGHSLRLAMWRLGGDRTLRQTLGRAGQRYWTMEHSLESMVEDYRRVIPMAMARPAPQPGLPDHLRASADGTLHRLLAPFGLTPPLR